MKFSQRLAGQAKDILIITVITVGLLEIFGIFVKPNEYFWDFRNLFVSKDSFRTIEENGLWTYKPDSTILSASIYHFFGIGWIEWRCSFRTNKFGFVDTNYNDENSVGYLVLGDSFTVGQGGCPWLTRDRLQSGSFPKIINAALEGIGLEEMEKISAWLEKQVKVKNLVLIAISNDFKRAFTPWLWRDHQSCLNDGICDPFLDTYWGVPYDISDASLYAMSRKKAAIRHTFFGFFGRLDGALTYYSFTYNVIRKLYSRVTPPKPPIDWLWTAAHFSKGFESVRRLKQRFPEMKIILVPQRDEVGLFGLENFDTKVVKTFLDANGYEWKECPLGMGDYMPIDGHPNQLGYEKIFKCFSSLL
jgi:hypothetical protein